MYIRHVNISLLAEVWGWGKDGAALTDAVWRNVNGTVHKWWTAAREKLSHVITSCLCPQQGICHLTTPLNVSHLIEFKRRIYPEKPQWGELIPTKTEAARGSRPTGWAWPPAHLAEADFRWVERTRREERSHSHTGAVSGRCADCDQQLVHKLGTADECRTLKITMCSTSCGVKCMQWHLRFRSTPPR